MKKYFSRLTIIIFVIISCPLQAMDAPAAAKITNTLLWLADNMIIISSNKGCYLKNPFSKVGTIQLHPELAHDIILNKDKTKVGLFCQNSFIVYDIPTKKNIWSLPISYSDNYSATFSSTDDIILCHQGNVSINYSKPLRLPFLQADESFGITCNHKNNTLMYPSSNNTFSIKSLETNQIARYPRLVTKNNKKYRVNSATYNPYSDHIILYTHQKDPGLSERLEEFFLLDSKTNKLTQITSSSGEERPEYHQIRILPNSSVAAALCDKNGIHFFDFIQGKQILLDLFTNSQGYACKSNKNALDFNAQATYYAILTHKKYFRRATPQCLLRYIFMKNHICFSYLILCQYFQKKNIFIPKEIKGILIEYLHKVYKLPEHINN